MRTLVDCHWFDARTEGVTTYLRSIYTRLIAERPDVEFVMAASDTGKLRQTFGDAPNVRYVRLRSSSRMARLLVEYPRIARRLRPDAVHFQYMLPPLMPGRKVVTLHDLLFLDFPHLFPPHYRLTRRLAFGRSARMADALLTVSEYSRRSIARHLGIDADRITVTPNEVSDEFLDVDRAAAREFARSRGIERYILNVSRLEPRKNQLALLRAFDELGLADRGMHLVLIGLETLPVPELKAYLAAMQPARRRAVHLFSHVPQAELPLWYAGARLFVYPSLGEGFGIPPIEAAATGTPVICHNSTAMSEFGFFGDNLGDLSDPATLRALIMRNLDTPPDQARLSAIAETLRLNRNLAVRRLSDALGI